MREHSLTVQAPELYLQSKTTEKARKGGFAMKKLLTLLLSLAMLASMSVTSFATELGPSDLDENGCATASTAVTYLASSSDANASDREAWTLTVPATMSADASGATISVTGAIPESKTLRITAPESVRLYLDGNENGDYTERRVDFEDIALVGNYKQTSVSANAKISVQNMSDIKFGVWSGALTFTVEMSDSESWQAHNVLTQN